MQVQPYLFFDGRCEEAIDFYKKAVGAEVGTLLHFSDAPDPSMRTDENRDKIMHSALKIGDSTILASDGRRKQAPKFGGFALTITAANKAEAEKLFAALSEGGTVTTPLTKTFFSPGLGTLTDRFGVGWTVIASR